MSQQNTKFIKDNAVTNAKAAQLPANTIKGNNTGSTANASDLTVSQTQTMLGVPTTGSPLPINAGGTGQTTQQTAINALTGTQSSGKYLRSDGTNSTLATIVAGDVPTLNQNTTGTASNITASSNSTLTTLSALSLPGAQVTGNISGNAANVTGVVALVNGGTGTAAASANAAFNALSPMTTLGDITYENATPAATRLAGNTTATKNFLTQTGTGTVSAAPAWGTIQAGDVPTLNQNTTGTAANITATSNSTLTTLSSLSLPGAQVTGNISGNAANVTGVVALTNGGTGTNAASANAAFNALSPMTTGGDVIYGGASGVATRLANGSSGQVLTSNGGTTAPSWQAASGSSPLTTKGDTFVYSSANARLPVGTDYQSIVADSSATTGLRYQTNWQGPKNYIQYYNFENQQTTGYSLGTTGTLTNGIPTGSPTFGSGASGNLSTSIVTSGQIAGSASLSYASSAATTAGNMLASSAFTVDKEDQSQVMNFSISYIAQTNPANGNWSGTSSSSFGVALYDVTNSAWINSPNSFAFTQSVGVGKATGTFQLSATGTSYRLVIYNANATAGAITLYFDNIIVGPNQFNISNSPVAISYYCSTNQAGTTSAPFNFDTKEFDNTGTVTTGASWSFVAPVSGYYQVDLSAQFTASGTAGINLWKNGSAYKQLGFGNTNYPIGSGSTSVQLNAGDSVQIRPSASLSLIGGTLTTNGVSTLAIFLIQPTVATGSTGQVVAARARVVTGTSVTAGSPINFDTVDFDTVGAITTGAAWKYTAPITGYYAVQADINSSTSINFQLYKNGSQVSGMGFTSSTGFAPGFSLVQANAGDTLQVVVSATGTLANAGGSTTTQSNYVNIFLLQGTSTSVSTNSTTPVTSTINISATSAYTFTIPSSSVTAGAVYSTPNGSTFTVSATIAAQTTLTCAGSGAPNAAANTLTKVSGTGPATLAYSATTSTGQPAIGTTVTNSTSWIRQGPNAVITYKLEQVSGTVGTGDYVLYLPTGLVMTSAIVPSNIAAGTYVSNAAGGAGAIMTSSSASFYQAANYSIKQDIVAYSNNSFRYSGISQGNTGFNWSPSNFPLNSASTMFFAVTITVPILGWS